MESLFENLIKSYCSTHNIACSASDDGELSLRFPAYAVGVSQPITTFICHYPETESLKVWCELGRAYGSRLNQALRLNNILKQSCLSVVRRDGRDCFNLIFWHPIDGNGNGDEVFDMKAIVTSIHDELEKIRSIVEN